MQRQARQAVAATQPAPVPADERSGARVGAADPITGDFVTVGLLDLTPLGEFRLA